jgi:hypothetical protein
LTKGHTIPRAADVLELKNVPTELILYTYWQWEYCGEYKAAGNGKNVNRFLRHIAIWIILKNMTTSGVIKKYRDQLPDLARACKMSETTMQRYVYWLQDEGLVTIHNRNLVLKDYKFLQKKYGINIKEREQTIFYDVNDNKKLSEILISVALLHKQSDRMQVYWNKVTQNQDMYKLLYDLLVQFGADSSRLQNPEYFRECHLELQCQTYQEEKPGQPAFNFIHNMLKANPDLNCKASTYGRQMGYAVFETANPVTKKDESRCMCFGHLKKRLMKKGLIDITVDHIESEVISRKDERVYHHRYNRKSGKTVWFRPDQIAINKAVFFTPKTAA